MQPGGKLGFGVEVITKSLRREWEMINIAKLKANTIIIIGFKLIPITSMAFYCGLIFLPFDFASSFPSLYRKGMSLLLTSFVF